MKRTIKRILDSSQVDMGNLLTRQPIPGAVVQQLDPFLLLHHTGPKVFPPHNRGLPFAPHPHKGFETVTFIFEGAVEHKDSTGHHSTIHTGGVQWMTAGRGIVHSENLPASMQEKGGRVEYIQLWINLPAKFKSLPAKYQGIQKDEVPEFTPAEGVKARLISGAWQGHKGPAHSVTGIEAMELYMDKDSVFEYQVEDGREILFYVLNGSLKVNQQEVKAHQAVQFAQQGTKLLLEAGSDARILICSGDPIGEPVVSHGPFVMNTQTEIMQAMRDYQTGKMGMVID